MQTSATNFTRHRARRGTAYLVVMGMVSLLLVSALAASMASRLEVRTAGQINDAQRAEVLAESAVSYALAKLAADTNWRTTYTNNVESATAAVGGGKISFKLVDETDGNLANVSTHSIRIYGYGRVGNATKVLSVVAAGTNPLTCLKAAMSVGGDFTPSGITLNAIGSSVTTNGSFTSSSSSVMNTNVEASGTVNTSGGTTFNGTQTSGATARSMPDANVFDYYLANGTRIPYSSLSSGTLNGKVISPQTSGFSGIAANPKGIYIIDCAGNKIILTNSRIVGTLVILNPGPGSATGDGVGRDALVWSPAVPNFPCLLVKGSMAISNATSELLLVESTYGYNFNPSSTPYPYPGGTSDSDATDSYPAKIDGLVYVSGNDPANPTGTIRYPTMSNLIVGGTCTAAKDQMTLTPKLLYYILPPPGFTGGGTLQTVPGTWRWESAS